MSTGLICELAIAIISIIPTFIALWTLIKTIIKNKNWELIKKFADAAMTTTEKYSKDITKLSSEEKLNMALDVIKTSCAAVDIEIDVKLLSQIIAYIEEMCKWSKTVNAD